ncbi:MAG: FHA domain-containing protein [Chloroflexota bacterium]
MKLVVLEGPAERATYDITAPRTLIGRAPDCQVRVYDAQVSRHHAHILRIGEELFIEGLQQGNPVIVNDRFVTGRQSLADRDLIIVGGVLFEVDLPPMTQAVPPRAPVQATPPEIVTAPPHAEPQQRPGQTIPRSEVAARDAGASPAAGPPQQGAPRPPDGGQPPSGGQPPIVAPGPDHRPIPQVTPHPIVVPASPATPLNQPPPPAVERRTPRPSTLPPAPPLERVRAVAARLAAAGQRMQTRGAPEPSVNPVRSTDAPAVDAILAGHEKLGGDAELARLAALLSYRTGNQTDMHALYRLGADARALIAWSRMAQQSIEEACHLADVLGAR